MLIRGYRREFESSLRVSDGSLSILEAHFYAFESWLTDVVSTINVHVAEDSAFDDTPSPSEQHRPRSSRETLQETECKYRCAHRVRLPAIEQEHIAQRGPKLQGGTELIIERIAD